MQVTDRKSQVTGSQYDALDRLTQVTFADTSTIAYTYDAGDRITQIVDSTNGTTTRTYDTLDRLTQETTPQGTVNYTYDADSRRGTMTVAGQTAVSYAYDNAQRLTSITQGTRLIWNDLLSSPHGRRCVVTTPADIRLAIHESVHGPRRRRTIEGASTTSHADIRWLPRLPVAEHA
jgi:YD repeat-containing protein